MNYLFRNLFPLLLLTFVGNTCLYAQQQGKLLISHYIDEDYTGHPQNLDVIFDNDGILYLGNSSAGVIAYDGKVWQKIPGFSQTGRSMARTADGTIYIGSHNELGYINNKPGSPKAYNSLKPLLNKDHGDVGTIWHIHTIDNSVYFYSNEGLYIYQEDSINYIPFEKKIYRQFQVNGNIYLNNKKTFGLERLEGAELKTVPIVNNPLKRLIAEILPFDDEHILVVSRYEGLYLLNIKTNHLQLIEGSATKLLQKDRIHCALTLANGNLALGSAFSGIYILDSSSNLIRKIEKNSGLIDQTIWKMSLDNAGNLWAATNNGLTKVELATGLEYWDDKSGLSGIPISIKKINDILYSTSTVGLFTLKNNQFHQIQNFDNFSNQIIQLNGPPNINGKIIVSSDRGIFQIANDKAIPFLPVASYLIHQYQKDPSYLIISDFDSGIHIYFYDGKNWILKKGYDDLKKSGSWASSITEDINGNIWLATEESGVVQISNPTGPTKLPLKFYAEDQNLSTKFAYSIDQIDQQIILYSQNGFYQYNSDGDVFEKDTTLSTVLGFSNPDVSVYPFSKGVNDDLWMAAQKNGRTSITGAYSQGNGNYRLDTTGVKRIYTKSVNTIFPDSNYVWIGTPDRVYRYQTNGNNKAAAQNFNAIINRINVGKDSLHFQGHLVGQMVADSNDIFDYENNFLRFTFGATSYFEEAKTAFSYRLNGFSDQWSEWSLDDYKEFSNLPEGKYTFELKAKNIFGKESNVSSYTFEVLPPWYRTFWAYLAVAILGMLFIYLLVKIYNGQLKKENEYLESLVKNRTEEVESQKASLEASNQRLKSTIDKLTHAQSQLIQSEKMASLGQLTAGIAHEINNPINYVSSSAEALKLDYLDVQKVMQKILPLKQNEYSSDEIEAIIKLKDDLDLEYTLDEMNHLFTGIEEGANRTQEIVKSLRIFSRNTSESFHLANINEGIDSTLLMLNNQITSKITLEKKYGDLPRVNCQISKLNQVFLNIIVNALHALESRKDKSAAGHIFIETKKIGDQVSILIRDNGPGMPLEISQKVFEPFFTTKEVGKGTGLGLSVSYGIIKDHQGTIEVNSEEGKGTTFIIKIPIRPEGRDEG